MPVEELLRKYRISSGDILRLAEDQIGLKGVLELLDKALAENWKLLDATGYK